MSDRFEQLVMSARNTLDQALEAWGKKRKAKALRKLQASMSLLQQAGNSINNEADNDDMLPAEDLWGWPDGKGLE